MTGKKRKVMGFAVLAVLFVCLLLFFWPRTLDCWTGGQDIARVHATAGETTFSLGGIDVARWTLEREAGQETETLEEMLASCRYRLQLRTLFQPGSYEVRSAKTAMVAFTLTDGSSLWVNCYGDFVVIEPGDRDVRIFAVPTDKNLTDRLADYLISTGEKQ